jgi:mRNA interferase MazF
MTAQRGQVFRVDLGHGAKPWLIVSNNSRNRNLESVLAVRISTTGKHAHHSTVITLTQADPLVGCVLCDDLIQLFRDELTAPLGALAPGTMAAVSDGLRVALAL